MGEYYFTGRNHAQKHAFKDHFSDDMCKRRPIGERFLCTRHTGHSGAHEASNGYKVVARWSCDPIYSEPIPPPRKEKKGKRVKVKITYFIDTAGRTPMFQYDDTTPCMVACPMGGGNMYVCTRKKGHTGPHEGHKRSDTACCRWPPTWDDGIPPDVAAKIKKKSTIISRTPPKTTGIRSLISWGKAEKKEDKK